MKEACHEYVRSQLSKPNLTAETRPDQVLSKLWQNVESLLCNRRFSPSGIIYGARRASGAPPGIPKVFAFIPTLLPQPIRMGFYPGSWLDYQVFKSLGRLLYTS